MKVIAITFFQVVKTINFDNLNKWPFSKSPIFQNGFVIFKKGVFHWIQQQKIHKIVKFYGDSCNNKVRIGLYRENAIAIESEARDPFGGNVYYVTMQITFPIPEFARKERTLHCDIVHVTTKWVSRLVLDHAIAAIQTSR